MPDPTHCTYARDTDRFRESERLYRFLVENAGAGVGIVDESEVFLFVNDAGARAFGTTPARLVQRSLLDFLDREQEQVMRRETADRQPDERRSYTLVVRGEDGVERALQVTTTPFWDEMIQARCFLGVFQDVSSQRKMEERLLAMHKLETLGALAAGVAHDFNNLHTAILGYAEIVSEQLPEDSSLKSCMQEIIQASRRASELSDGLLTYAGRRGGHAGQTDVNDAITDARRLLNHGKPRGVRLELELQSALPFVMADRQQLTQVVLELVSNAFEALAESGGTVTVRSSTFRCDGRCLEDFITSRDPVPGDYVVIDVQDDGPGMNEEIRNRVFDPFFSTRSLGRGLGLATVSGIVRGHNGGVLIRSIPGEGTTVRIALPALEGREEYSE